MLGSLISIFMDWNYGENVFNQTHMEWHVDDLQGYIDTYCATVTATAQEACATVTATAQEDIRHYSCVCSKLHFLIKVLLVGCRII